MKLAILGKGGSGKSTVAAHLARWFSENKYSVLAIDADHNMDLGFNLGIRPGVFLGSDPDEIKDFVGVRREQSFKEALTAAEEKQLHFFLSPADPYTKKYTNTSDNNMMLMTAGPHTDRVRTHGACSHSLAAPLKVYLPRLNLKENEIVIIDERAGTDPVATGILNGIDLALVVREQTANSYRVAEQIVEELKIQNISYLLVDNKLENATTDLASITKEVTKVLKLIAK